MPVPPFFLLPLERAERVERGVDLIEDLHQRAGRRHDDEVAVDDVAELVRDDGLLLVLVEELEDAFGDDDARVGAQQAVGEGGRVAVGDKSDARRAEAVLVGDGMHRAGARPGSAPCTSASSRKASLLNQRSDRSRDPRADEPDHRVDDDGERDGEREIDLAGGDQRGERSRRTTMPSSSPTVTNEAKNSRAITSPYAALQCGAREASGLTSRDRRSKRRHPLIGSVATCSPMASDEVSPGLSMP